MRNCFRFLFLFIVTASPAVADQEEMVAASSAVADQEELCGGELVDSDTVTQIDIKNSEVTVNTLHMIGGELRFGNVGEFDGIPLDLVVSITGGEYTSIAQVWADKGKDESKNGKNGGFANINLQTVEGVPHSGQGDFEICFVESGTTSPVVLEAFRWSVSDIDARGADEGAIEEELLLDVSQAHSFQMWPDSEVDVFCEDGAQIPCREDVRTIFHSTAAGTGKDRPTDPNNMTEDQMKRTVEFTFKNTDCFRFTYDHYCPTERGSEPAGCNFYSGGNFLFSGVASVSDTVHTGDMHDLTEIVTIGDCFL